MTSTRPVVVHVSHATRLIGSCSISASRMASDIWSHILSGWPSVTDSDVNKSFSIAFSPFLLKGACPFAHFLPGWIYLGLAAFQRYATQGPLQKTARIKRTVLYYHKPILLLFDYSLRLAPSTHRGLPQLHRSFVSPLL